MGLIEPDEMRQYLEVLAVRSVDPLDFELLEVDLTDPASDELSPMKGYVDIRCRSTGRRKSANASIC